MIQYCVKTDKEGPKRIDLIVYDPLLIIGMFFGFIQSKRLIAKTNMLRYNQWWTGQACHNEAFEENFAEMLGIVQNEITHKK
jgi:hypothetical protein